MDESKAKQIAAKWSQVLCERGILHAVFGSVAMLIHQCEPLRPDFQDIDFLLRRDSKQEVKGILTGDGFIEVEHGNYRKDGVTIGISTHAIDISAQTKIGGVCVLTLDGLIDSKIFALESLINQIVKRGYTGSRETSAIKQLNDFFAVCRKRDEQNTHSYD